MNPILMVRVRALLVVVLLFLAAAPLARGQDEPVQQAGPLAMPYSSRSLGATCRILGLDAQQTAAARELHQGYRAAFRSATAKARATHDEALKKAQADNDFATFAK